MASTAVAGESSKVRVFFIPFFMSSHMVPMLEIARLFASRPGVEATMVVTPANAALIRPAIDLSAAEGHPVHILLYPFPSAVGLPEGQENLCTVPPSEEWRLFKAIKLCAGPHDRILRDHLPDAVVSDVPFWWTTWTAKDLGIPRITFFGTGAFPQCVMNTLEQSKAHERAAGDAAPFAVPDLPGRVIEMVRSELPAFLRGRDHVAEMWEDMRRSQMECYGSVVNTFYELEPEYCDLYRESYFKRTWFVGPVSLTCGDAAERGGRAEEGERCMAWLDAQRAGSVVYVSFGSSTQISPEQAREMAAGLDAAGWPFMFVVRGEAEVALAPASKGVVVRGWVPQVAILEHAAVGAFITHCGWNSMVEAVAAGKPMLTWPLLFDQFISERLAVGVLGVGARLCGGFRSTEPAERLVVPGGVISEAVAGIMGEGGEKARAKARELAGMARAAMAEGGSSRRDLDRLLDELVTLTEQRKRQ